MSGAQAKAAVIAGCIGVVAEVLCITVTQKLHYAFLNWSIFACSSDHLSSNPVVRLGIQFLNPSIYLYLSPPRYSVSIQELYVYLSERNQKPQRLESLRGRQIFLLVRARYKFARLSLAFALFLYFYISFLFVIRFLCKSSFPSSFVHPFIHPFVWFPVNSSPQQTRHN